VKSCQLSSLFSRHRQRHQKEKKTRTRLKEPCRRQRKKGYSPLLAAGRGGGAGARRAAARERDWKGERRTGWGSTTWLVSSRAACDDTQRKGGSMDI